MGSLSGEDSRQGGIWRSHIHVQINQKEQLGSKTDSVTQGSNAGNKTSKPLVVRSCGGLGWWEKLPASPESLLERPMGS